MEMLGSGRGRGVDIIVEIQQNGFEGKCKFDR